MIEYHARSHQFPMRHTLPGTANPHRVPCGGDIVMCRKPKRNPSPKNTFAEMSTPVHYYRHHPGTQVHSNARTRTRNSHLIRLWTICIIIIFDGDIRDGELPAIVLCFASGRNSCLSLSCSLAKTSVGCHRKLYLTARPTTNFKFRVQAKTSFKMPKIGGVGSD